MKSKNLLRLFIVFACLYLGVMAFVYVFQRSFLYLPTKDYVTPAAASADARLKEWKVKTEDGLDLTGWYAPKTSKPYTIVFFHGNADYLHTVAPLALPYLAQGYGFLIVEYRGYSGEMGAPTEQGLYTDARAYIKALIASGVKEKNLVLFGHSLGSGVATQMATEFHARGLILLTPHMSIAKMGQVRFPWMPAEVLTIDRFENFKKIPTVHMPLLLAVGDRDLVIPPAQGKQLFELANEPKTLKIFPEGGHSDLFKFGFGEASLEWLDALAK